MRAMERSLSWRSQSPAAETIRLLSATEGFFMEFQLPQRLLVWFNSS
jgi:hypothetical protein